MSRAVRDGSDRCRECAGTQRTSCDHPLKARGKFFRAHLTQRVLLRSVAADLHAIEFGRRLKERSTLTRRWPLLRYRSFSSGFTPCFGQKAKGRAMRGQLAQTKLARPRTFPQHTLPLLPLLRS